MAIFPEGEERASASQHAIGRFTAGKSQVRSQDWRGHTNATPWRGQVSDIQATYGRSSNACAYTPHTQGRTQSITAMMQILAIGWICTRPIGRRIFLSTCFSVSPPPCWELWNMYSFRLRIASGGVCVSSSSEVARKENYARSEAHQRAAARKVMIYSRLRVLASCSGYAYATV
jgi:hypothetical protein